MAKKEHWKKWTPARREEFDSHVRGLKSKVGKIVDKREHFAFGHGYIWATVAYKGKRVKVLLGGIDGRKDWNGIESEVRELETVEYTYINPD